MIFSEQSTIITQKIADLYYNKVKEAIEDLLPEGFKLSKRYYVRRDMRKPIHSPKSSFNIAELETPYSSSKRDHLLLTIPRRRGGIYITKYGYADTVEELRGMVEALVQNEIRLSIKRKAKAEKQKKHEENIHNELDRIWSNDTFGEYRFSTNGVYQVRDDIIDLQITVFGMRRSLSLDAPVGITLDGVVTPKINGVAIGAKLWHTKFNYSNSIRLLRGDFDFDHFKAVFPEQWRTPREALWHGKPVNLLYGTNGYGVFANICSYYVWKFFRVVNGKPIIPPPPEDIPETAANVHQPFVHQSPVAFITHTDYGPAGVVIKHLPNGKIDVVSRLLSMQHIFHRTTLSMKEAFDLLPFWSLPSGSGPMATEQTRELPKELLGEINDSFREQILKLRVRKEVSKARGRFESVIRLNVIYEDLNINQSIVQDIIELLSPVLSKYSNISIRPIASIAYTRGRGSFAEIYQVDTGAAIGWIGWDANRTLYVGTPTGRKQEVSSDENLLQTVDNMVASALAKPKSSSVRRPRATRYSSQVAQQGPIERFPGQKFYKDVEDDQYFNRKIYVRAGAVPGAHTAALRPFNSPGQPFMLSIHSTDALAKWPSPGEPGFPQGIFTGLDLHMVSTFGKRPGHVGWIGGTISEHTMYIVEVQSDLMQRTWDMIDRAERDVSRSVGKGKTKEIVMSLKHRMREIASAMKMERMELAKLRSAQYGRMEDVYASMSKVADLDKQYRTIRARYDKFTRLPMFYKFKSKVENTFKDWIEAFYNDAINYAKDVGVDTIKIITTPKAMEAHKIKNVTETDVVYRVYDGAAKSLGAEISDDGWWTLNLTKNENFDRKLQLVLNENIYGNVATVFHGTRLASAAKSMAIWGHFPGLRGSYGQGVYAIYDDDAVAKHRSYGDYMIKYKVNMSGFLILNNDAKIVYGNDYKPSDQLDKMGIPWRKMGDQFQEMDPWELQVSIAHTDVPALVKKLDSSFPSAEHMYDILKSPLRTYLNGIFFTGGHGKELIGFDSSLFKPVAFGIRAHASPDSHMIAMPHIKWYAITDENMKILDKHIENEMKRG